MHTLAPRGRYVTGVPPVDVPDNAVTAPEAMFSCPSAGTGLELRKASAITDPSTPLIATTGSSTVATPAVAVVFAMVKPVVVSTASSWAPVGVVPNSDIAAHKVSTQRV